MKKSFDLVVIGTGDAGSTAAGRCRAAGWNVAIVDSREFGGTCGLRGCDPKKILVGAAEIIDRERRMQNRGISPGSRIDWRSLIRFKRTFTDPFPKAREDSFRSAGIETLHGRARFAGRNSVQVNDDVLEASHLLIATGAWPAKLNIPGEEHLTRSDQFLELDELPKRLIFIGGGYIAFEFSHVAARAGSQVTILHKGERPLERFDADLVGKLVERTRKLGIEIRTKTKAIEVQGKPGRLKVIASADSKTETFEANVVVHAAGRAPELADLDLPAADVEFDSRGVKVSPYLQSVSNPAVYAAGDAANSGGLPQTPIADYEGDLVARNLLEGNQYTADFRGMSSVVFTIPPLARVGLTEEDARRQGRSFEVKQGDTSGWYSARRVAEEASAYKTLLDMDSGRILGAHLIGPEADELANIFVLAIRAGIDTNILKKAPFAYPTQASNIKWMV
ncbi:MAG TPA: NAD(P)/FAD-dependent oxidoreductase [Bryobacteraceae bacterium]